MDHGEIIQVGTPSDIYEYPTSKFVADFVGSVNLFEGHLVEDEPDHVRVECPELGRLFLRGSRGQRPAEATVWVALRPEKVFISRESPGPGGDNQVSGVIKEIAYLGDLSVYLVQLPTGRHAPW